MDLSCCAKKSIIAKVQSKNNVSMHKTFYKTSRELYEMLYQKTETWLVEDHFCSLMLVYQTPDQVFPFLQSKSTLFKTNWLN